MHSHSHRRSAANAVQRNVRRASGFTMVELVMVVAIIGILAVLTIPSLQKYIYRAQRNEAYVHLRAVFSKQNEFFNEYGRYGDSFTEIGFELPGGTLIDANTIDGKYYTYTVKAIDFDGVQGQNFQAIATADLDPSDDVLDVLMIENGVTIIE
jgi:type IV pilus assembly protein PilA